MKTNELELIERSKAGCKKSFGILYQQNFNKIRNFIANKARDRDIAEDVTQEAFTKAFVGIGNFDPKVRFSSWVTRIAYHVFIDTVRSPGFKANTSLEDAHHCHSPQRDSLTMVIISEEIGMIQIYLSRLDLEHKSISDTIRLRFYSGLSYEEIAEKMGKPLGTVKGHIFMGKAILKRYIEEAKF